MSRAPAPPRSHRALLAASAVAFLALSAAGAGRLGVFYEEVVAYVFAPLDIVQRLDASVQPPAVEWADHRERAAGATAGRFVVSEQLPRLAVRGAGERRYPVLNQVYMTNHVSYGGALLGRALGDPVRGARAFHALFGLLALWLLYDVGARLASSRVGALAAALAACSPNFVFMFTWARLDESLPSVAALAALAAAVRHHTDPRPRWLLLAALAAGVGVSAKLTTLWPLFALGLAAAVAGVRPRARWRTWALAALVFAVWMVPMAAYALLAPASPTSHEAARRLAFIADLVRTDVLWATARNLVRYLGGWAALIGEIARGPDAHGGARPNPLGVAVTLATLAHLAAAALGRGPVPRRARLETAMLVVVLVLFALVALFYREHADYQFVLLVPLFSLAVARALDAAATRLAASSGGARAGALLAALALAPLGAQAYDQARMLGDLGRARNAMLDLHAQRASAEFLAARGIRRPITVTFYAAGQYELLTRGAVRPLHAFALFRANVNRAPLALRRTWRRLLELDAGRARYVLLPRGRNVVEERHFDEAAIREAFLAQAALEPGGSERLAVFTNRAGEPLLELYALAPRPAGRTVREPPEDTPPRPAAQPATAREEPRRAASAATRAALGGLAPGERVGAFVVESVDEPAQGAVRVAARRGEARVEFDVRLDDPASPAPPARAGRYAVYYRRPAVAVPASELVDVATAIARRAGAARAAVPGLTPLPR